MISNLSNFVVIRVPIEGPMVLVHLQTEWCPWGCFTNVLQALQNILSKFMYSRIRTFYENFKFKLCMCTQSHAVGTHTKFQLEILNINVISGIMYFDEIILESLKNVSETTPCFWRPFHLQFLAATKQLYEWFSPSVCLSVRPSVTPFWLCSHHRIIMKFSGVITSDRSDVHAKGRGKRSKVKVTEVTTQLNRFRTVTPVWIHMWWWNDAYSLIMLRRGALLFLKVIRQISRSHGSKNRWIWPKLGVSGL